MEWHIFTMFIFIQFHVTNTFNIDVDASRLAFNVSSDDVLDTQTNFGFSISFFKTTSFRLIVGAPKMNNKAGAVFQCPFTGSTSCSPIDLTNPSPISERAKYLAPFGHAGQLGSFTKTTDTNVVVCSPSWNDIEYWEPFGRCITLNKSLNITEYRGPCIEPILKDPKPSKLGFCQSGHSLEIIQSKSNVNYTIIANIGAWNNRGALVVMKGEEIEPEFVNLERQEVIERNINNVITSKSKFTDMQSFLGFDTSAGAFQGPAKEKGVAAGAPRAKLLVGQALVYAFEITNTANEKATLTLISTINDPDEQAGAFFGSSLTSIDYNSDGYDDLVIGAPLHAPGNGLDRGKVYIFKNTLGGTVFEKETHNLIGPDQDGARFGTNVVNIGDLNGDGNEDLAISAPFGGEDRKGVVFIYNVRNNRIGNPSQVINSPGGRRFGYSIASKIIDSRVYPALAIGAPMDGQVYLYQAKTIITLNGTASVSNPKIPSNRTKYKCIGPDGNNYHCINLTVALTDIGNNTPSEFNLQVEIFVDTTKNLDFNKRVKVLDQNTNTLELSTKDNVTIQRKGSVVITKTLYFFIERTTDFVSPIVLATKYSFIETSLTCGNNICPILDQFGTINNRAEVKYLRECGEDDVCESDLVIEETTLKVPNSKNENALLFGSVYSEVVVSAVVQNYNESAYNASMKITYSAHFELVQINTNNRSVEVLNQNGLNTAINNEISFLLANPLRNGKSVVVKAKFSLRKNLDRSLFPSSYNFTLAVTSQGHETKPEDNEQIIQIYTGIETCLFVSLEGSPEDNKPPPVIFNISKEISSSITSYEDIGPLGKYNFQIENKGKTTIEDIEIELNIVDYVTTNDLLTKVTYVYGLSGDSVSVCNSTQVNDGNYQVEIANKKQNAHLKSNGNGNRKLNCKEGSCKTYTCNIATLPPDGATRLQISFAVYSSTLKKLNAPDIENQLRVKFGGNSSSRFYQSLDCDKLDIKLQQNIQIIGNPERTNRREWWIVLIAVVGALYIIATFCVILFRIGFFKRDYREEEQPLRNEEDIISRNESLEESYVGDYINEPE